MFLEGGLAFSPDGKYIASSSKSIRDIMNGGNWNGIPPAMWEVTSGNPIGEGSWTKGEGGIAHNTDSSWAPNEVVAWQFAQDNAMARQFASYFGPAQTISANGHVGARITEPRDKAAIEILEVPSNRKLATLPGPFVNAWGLALSPDGKYLATGGDRDSVHIFETGTWKEIFTAEYKQPYGIHELVFSADSKRLAGIDQKLHVWDMEKLRELYEIGGPPLAPITAVAASPDGQRLAVARSSGLHGTWHADPEAEIELWALRGGANS
jgi:WD40 repeat protein